MKIFGIRIYPQSVSQFEDQGSTIFVHDHLLNSVSDLDYIFRPLSERWINHIIVRDFEMSLDQRGKRIDPIPGLREMYGDAFCDADIKTQLVMIQADKFLTQELISNTNAGGFMPLFKTPPTFELLRQLFWRRDFVLSSDSWPEDMRSLLHNWDDIYWQLFTTEKNDIDIIIQTHRNDKKLKLYYVELDKEYPDPSNTDLKPVN